MSVRCKCSVSYTYTHTLTRTHARARGIYCVIFFRRLNEDHLKLPSREWILARRPGRRDFPSSSVPSRVDINVVAPRLGPQSGQRAIVFRVFMCTRALDALSFLSLPFERRAERRRPEERERGERGERDRKRESFVARTEPAASDDENLRTEIVYSFLDSCFSIRQSRQDDRVAALTKRSNIKKWYVCLQRDSKSLVLDLTFSR